MPGWTGYKLQSSGFIPCKPCALHYYITSLGIGRRSREKLPGWTGYNLKSSGFVPCKPCKFHYYVRNLGQGEEAGRSCQGGQGTTFSPVVSFLANPVHYTIRREGWDKEEVQGEVARVDGVQLPVQWFCSLQTL